MTERRNMPRWTRDPVWIPEKFRQSAVNRTPKTLPTPYEQAQGYIRMYLNHKINLDACYGLLLNLRMDDLRSDEEKETPIYWLTTEALDTMADHRDGLLDEIVLRGNLSNILHEKWEEYQP
jgi:hypothetical protein